MNAATTENGQQIFHVGDRVTLEDSGFPLSGAIIGLCDTGGDEPVALVALKQGFWGWAGESNRAEGAQAHTWISTLVVSLSNLTGE